MSIDIKNNISLAPYTVYKIGGKARFFVEVKNASEIKESLEFANKNRLPFFILGAGSNILVSDNGFPGVALKIISNGAEVQGEDLFVDAGVMMARVSLTAKNFCLSGFEWGVGIPGTVGGSIRGNAGCFGGEMKDVVKSVKFVDAKSLAVREINSLECGFSYRDSIFKHHPGWIILSAVLKLKKESVKSIEENIKKISLERVKKQDVGSKCCGCIFKNVLWDECGRDKESLIKEFPEFKKFSIKPGLPSSFLIDQAGLKGLSCGKVFVSRKHANFFVNQGGACSGEVVELIKTVKAGVKKKFGILLKEEIHFLE